MTTNKPAMDREREADAATGNPWYPTDAPALSDVAEGENVADKLVRFAYVPIGSCLYFGTHGTIVFKKIDQDHVSFGGGTYEIDLKAACRIIAGAGEQRGLKYQEADNGMHSANFGTHIKEAVAIVKDWAGEQRGETPDWVAFMSEPLTAEERAMIPSQEAQSLPARPETYFDRIAERIKPGEDAQAVRYIKELEAELSRLPSRLAELQEARLADQKVIIAKCEEIKELARLSSKGEDKCDVCCGDGVATGGRPCICGGSGLSGDEKIGLRKEIFRLEESLASKEEQGGWIEIKEGCEMPLSGYTVLVYAEGRVAAGYRRTFDKEYTGKAKKWALDSHYTDDVRYWMPLPTPPDSRKER